LVLGVHAHRGHESKKTIKGGELRKPFKSQEKRLDGKVTQCVDVGGGPYKGSWDRGGPIAQNATAKRCKDLVGYQRAELQKPQPFPLGRGKSTPFKQGEVGKRVSEKG